jgi:phosphate-selective porin OprO/OprP
MPKSWTARFAWTLSVATALGVVGAASAQPQLPALQPAAADVNQRLDRLEKLNETLLKQNQDLKQELQTIKTQEAPVSTGVDKAAVQNIVADYLQQQADKAKTEKKDEWYQVGSDTKMPGSWGLNRLTFESANKDFRAHLGGRFQFDSYYIGVPKRMVDFFGSGTLDDDMFFRRIRIEFDGKAYENIEWNFEVDLERNTLFEKLSNGQASNGNYPPTRFDELWVGLTNIPFLGNARIGHVRPPQGLECYTSSRNLMFLERTSGFEAFCQEFDPGVWFFNTNESQRLSWAATVHRIDGVSKAGESGKGDYAVTGRIAGLPIYENEGRCLVHLGGSYQIHSDSFNTSVKDRTVAFAAPPDWRSGFFTPNMVSTGTIISDHVDQFGLEALLIWGPFSVQSEYFGVHAADAGFPIAAGTAKQIGNANFNSWYVAASYFLTGENRRYDKRLGRIDRLVPNENFFFVRGDDGDFHRGKGAWEICARWDYIDLSDNDIKGGNMNNYTVGLNWYLNPNMKFQWNWTFTERNVDKDGNGGGAKGPSGPLHALGMRVQWEF